MTRRPDGQEGPAVIQQVRAAAALLAFVNALAVSLFGLVPGTNIGYPAAVLGIIGLFFTAASLRTILSSRATTGLRLGQTGLIVLLLLIFGTELGYGIAALIHPDSPHLVENISYALVTSVLVGIARAWELVGALLFARSGAWKGVQPRSGSMNASSRVLSLPLASSVEPGMFAELAAVSCAVCPVAGSSR